MKNKILIVVIYCLIVLVKTNAQQQIVTLNDLKIEKKATHFFVIGDWGHNGEKKQKDVAKSMNLTAEKVEPSFVISTGDNFYCCGVASTEDPQWKRSFEDIYAYDNLQIDWLPVIGNHDYRGSVAAEIDYTKISRKWNLPARYYTKVIKANNKKTMRLVFIDTNPLISKYYLDSLNFSDITKQDTAAQIIWIDSVLKSSKEDYKIVIGHHTIYSVGKKENGMKEVRNVLNPIFEKYHVNAYICGHDHNMQHIQGNNGINYFVSGAGADAEDKELIKDENTKFALCNPGFMLVSINENNLSFYFINSKNEIVYSYQY